MIKQQGRRDDMRLWERIKIRGNREIYYYDAQNDWETEVFALQLYGLIKEQMEEQNKKGVLFLCLGTDRSTGDSLGPHLWEIWSTSDILHWEKGR